ncbi:MAG: formylglycine-generating enzyme family protein, partial [Verrucomicrobia bacterium]|nr:formylglycine-generating enzyme family protein [Verrucomicrobiota bacterium]
AQAPAIESFNLNGELVCKGLKPGSRAAVEWAPTVNGPWSDSWTNLAEVLVEADGTVRVKVPMFYRVRGEAQEEPPPGMVLIPAGSFQMGNCMDPNEGWPDELPVHTVYVSAFYMDRYEVTKSLWDEVYQWATNHGYAFDTQGSGKAPDHPVQSVSWGECVKWCNARSEKEGRVPAYYTDAAHTQVYRTAGYSYLKNECVKWDAGYRLPTEAEWEKAARGGLEGKRFPWGDTIRHSQANYYSYWDGGKPFYSYDASATEGYHPKYAVGDYPYTSPVGSFAPNGYGLYDMAGNVWELCWDWYDAAYYSSSPGSDPRGPASGSERVVRGGGWQFHAGYCRVTDRFSGWPPNYLLGFRCVLPAGQ